MDAIDWKDKNKQDGIPIHKDRAQTERADSDDLAISYDNALHFCMYYRLLSAVKKLDAYPTPQTNKRIDSLNHNILAFARKQRLLASKI